MEMMNLDPKAQLETVSKEMKDQFDEAGMAAVEKFTDALDEVKDMLEKGPANLLEEMKKQFDGFKGKLQEHMDNPASLAPGSGGLSKCAGWYGKSVVSKLSGLNDEAKKMMEAIAGMVSGLAEPMKKLKDTLDSAMVALGDTVKKLAKLPAELKKLAGDISGPEDVAKIDTAPMKKCLDTSGIQTPLDSLAALKGPLESAIKAVVTGVDKIITFMATVPDKVKEAFDVPSPLCCLSSCLLSQAPEAMTKLLEMVESMKKLDMTPMKNGLTKVQTSICNLDPKTVSEPVNKFATSAGESVGKLDTIVNGAKQAGGLSALGSMWPSAE